MTRPERDPRELLPLSLPVFQIMLALGQDQLHGYAIMQSIETRTDGAVTLLPGTLYNSIRRMLADGLIEESTDRPAPQRDDQRRRYYRITAFGRTVARAEADRMAMLVRLAHEQQLRSEPAPSGGAGGE